MIQIQNRNTDLKVGLCLEPHDLAASKLAAGREKDWLFVEVMLRHNIVGADTLEERIKMLPIPAARIEQLKAWIAERTTKP